MPADAQTVLPRDARSLFALIMDLRPSGRVERRAALEAYGRAAFNAGAVTSSGGHRNMLRDDDPAPGAPDG